MIYLLFPQESEEEQNDDNEGEEESQEEEEKSHSEVVMDKETAKESEEDPATSVAGFMKVLFKGISNKISDEDRAQEEMINTFERRR